MSDETPEPQPESIGREMAGQAIRLAFAVGASVLLVLVQRAASDPDFARTARMRLAKTSERIAATWAARLWRHAETSRRRYENDAQ